MAEWAREEQLLAFAHDAAAILGPEGVRRPARKGTWVDALKIDGKL
jgi:hypothetical protein